MNYDKMLQAHIEQGASATIAVRPVPLKEASRFGIMNTNEEGDIVEFEEKPAHPKSNLASMGIYIFNWKDLRKLLVSDMKNAESDHDFGKNIIPTMLAEKKKLIAYRFEGYWKDVGTIDSLWEANMDLINPNIPIDLYDPAWKIYSRNPILPPQSIGKNAEVQNSMVTEGCYIDGSVEFSIISEGVTIEEVAVIYDSILMPGAHIKKGAKVEYAIVGEDTVIGENAQIGARPETIEDKDTWGVAVVGNKLNISDGATVAPKAIIYEDM
jgi:glucose-1-phosphate adenylyltransferase